MENTMQRGSLPPYCSRYPELNDLKPRRSARLHSVSCTAVCLIAGLAIHAVTSSASAQCKTGTTSWATMPLSAAQTGEFTVQFDATPSTATIDGLVGVSQSAGSGFTDYAAVVRFSVKGTIDVRNGNQYNALSTMAYVGGQTYHVRMVVNVATHTYSAYVTAPGQTEQLIGLNYAFRS
jgi:hypothetical protein